MTLGFSSTNGNSFATFSCGTFTQTLSRDGEMEDGRIFKLPTTTPEVEGSEKSILSKADSVTMWSTTNCFTYLQNGFGQGEKQLPDEMKKSVQLLSMKLQETLLENLENMIKELFYEQKPKQTEKNIGGRGVFDVRAC